MLAERTQWLVHGVCWLVQIVRSWSVSRCVMKPTCMKLASVYNVSYAHTQPSTPARLSTRGRHCLAVMTPSLPDSETDTTSLIYVQESVYMSYIVNWFCSTVQRCAWVQIYWSNLVLNGPTNIWEGHDPTQRDPNLYSCALIIPKCRLPFCMHVKINTNMRRKSEHIIG